MVPVMLFVTLHFLQTVEESKQEMHILALAMATFDWKPAPDVGREADGERHPEPLQLRLRLFVVLQLFMVQCAQVIQSRVGIPKRRWKRDGVTRQVVPRVLSVLQHCDQFDSPCYENQGGKKTLTGFEN